MVTQQAQHCETPPGTSLPPHVVTMESDIRGLGCSFAEKAQLKAWLARSGAQARDAAIGAYKQVHASYLCYDAPRKYPIKAVRAVCHQLLKEAGLTLRSPKMSDHIQEAYMAIDFAENRKRPWTCMAEIPPNMQLGQIWLPQQRLQLSGQAGAAFKEYLKRREHDKSCAPSAGGSSSPPQALAAPAPEEFF